MIENVYLIGLGGVGSNLVRPLFHYLSSLDSAPSLTIVDGDTVEPSNLSRQMYHSSDITVYKAQAIFRQLQQIQANPDFNLYHVPRYLNADIAKRGVLDRSLIISAVDNHKTNKLIQDHCDSLENVVYVCCTSHLEAGSILVHAKWQGQELLPKITQFHPEIAVPEDRHPDEPSCMATASEGSPQLITTNALAATTMLTLVSAVMEGRPVPAETFFNIRTFKVNPAGPQVVVTEAQPIAISA